MDPFFQKLLDPGKCELKTKKEIRVQINDIRSYSFQLKGLRIHIHIWIRIWFTERKKGEFTSGTTPASSMGLMTSSWIQVGMGSTSPSGYNRSFPNNIIRLFKGWIITWYMQQLYFDHISWIKLTSYIAYLPIKK